jgi:ketosteroid isomerase-like protein
MEANAEIVKQFFNAIEAGDSAEVRRMLLNSTNLIESRPGEVKSQYES